MSEIVTIVDRQNRIVDALPRAEMHARRLPHRASFVFVFREDGQADVQRRTLIKDVWPGYYDLAAGGVVLAHEEYKESALREVKEELGVSGVDLRGGIEFWFEDPSVQVWGMAYLCHFDGPLVLQPEEVAAVEEWDRHQLERARATGVRITPDSWVAWDHLRAAGLIDSLI